MINGTMMEYFCWFLPQKCKLWNKIKVEADNLSKNGITALYLPPAYKGMDGDKDVGYSVYDLYDLGEFNQKGSIETKYGYKDEYIQAIESLHRNNIHCYGDIVLNHKMGADFTEWIKCKEVDFFDRNRVISEEKNIRAWTGFEFLGRSNKYSDFKWNYNDFHGVDYDENTNKKSIYLFENKFWNDDVDRENENYDYLMGCDIDFSSQRVVDEFIKWGKWYVDIVSLDGFRLDAVKHISAEFYRKWINEIREYTGKEMFSVGEYWHWNVNVLLEYINKTDGVMSLFDVPLHYNFYNASNDYNYDMRKIFDNTLVSKNDIKAVTFVDNHDTEIGASLESSVARWFKLIAYGLILLKEKGYPCIFYYDYYNEDEKISEGLKKLIYIRRYFAYGKENNYFDNKNIIGWTREGNEKFKNSGIAVLISNNGDGDKEMYIGKKFFGQCFIDIIGNRNEEVYINKQGLGKFFVSDKSISVWVIKNKI